MRTYFVTYTSLNEEKIEATSVHVTSNVISFLKDEVVTFVVPVCQVMRIGLTRLPEMNFDVEPEPEDERRKAFVARLANLRTDSVKGVPAPVADKPARPIAKTADSDLKNFYVTYSRTGQEECIKADSMHATSKLVSFVQDGVIVFVVPVSEIIRLGENKYSPLADPEVEIEHAEKLKSARAWLEARRATSTQILN